MTDNKNAVQTKIDAVNTNETRELRLLTVQVITAALSADKVEVAQVPDLIKTVSTSLKGIGAPEVKAEPAPTPAVNPKRSVFNDYIVCLEDGKKLKMLKRHLKTTYNMTPAQYREKWGLPESYPMVAPAYAARRSELAKQIGLGRDLRRGS